MNIKEAEAVIEILRGILQADTEEGRTRRISAFQDTVWNDDTDPEGPLETIQRDLAHDLDFYGVQYGEERLRLVLTTAIESLED